MPDLATYISDLQLDRTFGRQSALQLGFVEACISLYERAFQVVEIDPPVVTHQMLGLIGRAMMSSGEIVCQLYGPGNDMTLVPCSSWYVWGDSPLPTRWTYDIVVPSPTSFIRYRRVENGGVAHFRIGASPATPWKGEGPLQKAQLTAEVTRLVEEDLRHELNIPVGRILVLPEGSNRVDPNTKISLQQAVQDKLGELAGGILPLTTTRAGFGMGPAAAPTSDYEQVQMRPEFNQQVLVGRNDLAISILGAFGVPPQLIMMGTADGTARREAWRQFLYEGVKPLGNIIEEELSRIFATKVSITYTDLSASDIQSRTRAYKQLIESGMEARQAAIITALEEE